MVTMQSKIRDSGSKDLWPQLEPGSWLAAGSMMGQADGRRWAVISCPVILPCVCAGDFSSADDPGR